MRPLATTIAPPTYPNIATGRSELPAVHDYEQVDGRFIATLHRPPAGSWGSGRAFCAVHRHFLPGLPDLMRDWAWQATTRRSCGACTS